MTVRGHATAVAAINITCIDWVACVLAEAWLLHLKTGTTRRRRGAAIHDWLRTWAQLRYIACDCFNFNTWRVLQDEAKDQDIEEEERDGLRLHLGWIVCVPLREREEEWLFEEAVYL